MSGVTKQDIGSLDSGLIIFQRVNHNSHFFRQTFLQRTQMRSGLLLRLQSGDLFLAQVREDLDILGGVSVAYVQPKLIEFIRRSIATIQPDITGFRLSELTTVSLRD